MHTAHPWDQNSVDFAVLSKVTCRWKHVREQQWQVNMARLQAGTVLSLGTDLQDTTEVMAGLQWHWAALGSGCVPSRSSPKMQWMQRGRIRKTQHLPRHRLACGVAQAKIKAHSLGMQEKGNEKGWEYLQMLLEEGFEMWESKASGSFCKGNFSNPQVWGTHAGWTCPINPEFILWYQVLTEALKSSGFHWEQHVGTPSDLNKSHSPTALWLMHAPWFLCCQQPLTSATCYLLENSGWDLHGRRKGFIFITCFLYFGLHASFPAKSLMLEWSSS